MVLVQIGKSMKSALVHSFFNLYQNHEILAWLGKEIFMVLVQIQKILPWAQLSCFIVLKHKDKNLLLSQTKSHNSSQNHENYLNIFLIVLSLFTLTFSNSVEPNVFCWFGNEWIIPAAHGKFQFNWSLKNLKVFLKSQFVPEPWKIVQQI